MTPPSFPAAQDGAPRLRLDVWEKGNISIVQLEEKLRAAARQALADTVMELQLLPASLCAEDTPPGIQTGMAGEDAQVGCRESFTEAPSEMHTHSCPTPHTHQADTQAEM